MKLQVIFATGNKDKIREIREIIDDPEMVVASTKELGIDSDPAETGITFQENALIKAWAAARILAASPSTFPMDPQLPTVILSDDSGLEVDALDGAPGIFSSRYMGKDTPYTDKMNHILEELQGKEGKERSARFVCACAAIVPKKFSPYASAAEEIVETATMEGEIAHEIKGEHGFGYDPFFYLPEYGKTSAELTDEEKNAISHRGKAFRAMIEHLTAYGHKYGF